MPHAASKRRLIRKHSDSRKKNFNLKVVCQLNTFPGQAQPELNGTPEELEGGQNLQGTWAPGDLPRLRKGGSTLKPGGKFKRRAD